MRRKANKHYNSGKHRSGRPRRPLLPPLAHTISEWCARTGQSPATVWRRMRAGKLKYVQDAPGAPRRIPTREYIRLGYVEDLSELVVRTSTDAA